MNNMLNVLIMQNNLFSVMYLSTLFLYLLNIYIHIIMGSKVEKTKTVVKTVTKVASIVAAVGGAIVTATANDKK